MKENIFEILLDFSSEWKVERVAINSENEVDIFMKFDLEEYKKNHIDDFEFVHDYSDYRRWRHLNILQCKTFINAKIPRVKLKDGKITSVKVPWSDTGKHHTYLFERLVIDLLLASKNQTKTAEILCCSFNLVNSIMHNATARGLEKRDLNGSHKFYGD